MITALLKLVKILRGDSFLNNQEDTPSVHKKKQALIEQYLKTVPQDGKCDFSDSVFVVNMSKMLLDMRELLLELGMHAELSPCLNELEKTFIQTCSANSEKYDEKTLEAIERLKAPIALEKFLSTHNGYTPYQVLHVNPKSEESEEKEQKKLIVEKARLFQHLKPLQGEGRSKEAEEARFFLENPVKKAVLDGYIDPQGIEKKSSELETATKKGM